MTISIWISKEEFNMETNKIREYIMVKDNFSHAKLEEIGCYDYCGELRYTDRIYDMLNRSFKMDSLITEVSYVIAFDHKKMPKGICRVGQGGLGETPTPMQPLFTFLLLAGASSFVVAHNHISDIPNASEADKKVTKILGLLATAFDMDFTGQMIINPNGYIIHGGTMDGTVVELDENGETVSWNANEEECDGEEDVVPDESKTIDDMLEELKALRKRTEGR